MNIKYIDIFSTLYVVNIARALSDILKKLNIESNVNLRLINNNDIDICRNDKNRYMFLFCPQWIYPSNIQPLPINKYFFYQLEQFDKNDSNHISNDFVYKLMRNSKHIFDYSKVNIQYYSKEPFNISNNKVTYLIPPIVNFNNNINNINNKSIDILFTGTLNSRRNKIIQSLINNGLNIKVVNNCFGNNLTELIKKSKIFLNIRFSNSVILETCRLHEALLSNDTYIVSEKPSSKLELDYINLYKNIYFIDAINNNTTQLINIINVILAIYDKKSKNIFDPTELNNNILNSLKVVFDKI